MKAEGTRKQRVSRRFRLVTPLPADLAIARLQELHDIKSPGLEPENVYQVNHERLGDTIYFEIRTLVDGAVSRSQKKIITGEIRELDPTRSEVKGEFQRIAIPYLRPSGILAICIFFALLAAAESGDWRLSLTVAVVSVVLVVSASILLNYRALDRAPTLERIELCLEPRAEDHELIARRLEAHRLHLSRASGPLGSGQEVADEPALQERG